MSDSLEMLLRLCWNGSELPRRSLDPYLRRDAMAVGSTPSWSISDLG